jgi:hypothetical protein
VKRTFVIAAVTLLAAFTVMMIDDGTAGEKPEGTTYYNYYVNDFDVSTGLDGVDTVTAPTGSSTKLFKFGGPGDYSSLFGYIMFEYTYLDTAGASTDMDTSKDTVAYDFFTSDGDGTPYKLIYTAKEAVMHYGAAVVNDDYNAFDLSDSTLWSDVYVRLRYWVADSTAALADSSYGAGIKATVKFFAK